jgi:hypothetical protein
LLEPFTDQLLSSDFDRPFTIEANPGEHLPRQHPNSAIQS